jgi:hypothetical protein
MLSVAQYSARQTNADLYDRMAAREQTLQEAKIGTVWSLFALLALGCTSTRTATDAEVNQCQATLTPGAVDPPPELSTFESFLNDYEAASPESKVALAQSFVERQQTTGGFPIVASTGPSCSFFWDRR